MDNWTIQHTVELSKAPMHLYGGALMVPNDSLGHTWEVTVLDDGRPATLSGNVVGYFQQNGGNYVTVSGTKSGNVCKVTLTQECYAYPGQLRGLLRITDGGTTVTLADVIFVVRNNLSGDPISGGSTIPNLDQLLDEISDLREATEDAEAVVENVYPLMELHYEGREVHNNLFDPDHYMNVTSARLDAWGALITTGDNVSNYGVSAYIPVVPGRYYYAELGLYTSIGRICFYDEDIVALAASTAIEYPKSQVFVAPEGAACMRITYLIASVDSVYVEEYSPQGVNLFNAYSHFNTDNRYLRRNSGNTAMQWNRTDSWGMSYYIPVTAGSTYQFCCTGIATTVRVIVYDADVAYKSEIDGTHTTGAWWSITIPTGGAYIRIPYAIARRYSMAEVAAGNSAPSLYAPYVGAQEGRGEPFKAYLPDCIYCAVGCTVEIYTRQVVLRPERFTVRWICDTGYYLARKFSVTGTSGTNSNIGNHSLTLQVLDKHGRMVYQKNATLMITAGLAATEKFLMIGDSLTKCDKPVLAEMVNLSGGKIVTVGGETGTANDADGVTRTTYSEAISGKSPLWFYTNSESPFYDSASSAFGWAEYVAAMPAASRPDAVGIMLGTNGMSEYPRINAELIKNMVADIRADSPSIPIFVAHTIYRSNQDGIGQETGSDGYSSGTVAASKYYEDEKVLDLMAEVERQLASAGLTPTNYVYTVGVGISMDAEYNFGLKAVPVNPRNTDFVEYVPYSAAKGKTDSIHPQDSGYYQIADVLYSALSVRL